MNIIQKLAEKYKQSKQKKEGLKSFEKILIEAVKDGKLTGSEIAQLEKDKENLGISEEDMKKFKINAYLTAFQNSKSDGKMTDDEEKELEKIQKYLQISDENIIATKAELSKLRLLNEIQKGNVPEIQVASLITQKGEKVYWSEPSSLTEEKVIRRGYEGGSQGFSFRVMKGVTYRVGAHKGNLITETGMVSVSTGDFIISNKRIVFRGNAKSFSIKLDKILDVQCYSDGIKIFENNKSNPRLIQFFNNNNGDVVGSILSYSINNYQA
ncbi:MAG: hypothetical protein HGB08_03115 [Candidatus Moranbacteria bacterium]|nr:hypothetical protein [Candidatus Moranbacteria bacterium]